MIESKGWEWNIEFEDKEYHKNIPEEYLPEGLVHRFLNNYPI